jgi:phosphate:Na+ symporter
LQAHAGWLRCEQLQWPDDEGIERKMTGIEVIINLAGAVAMLLWAARMVRTGVERAYGEVLRRKLRLATHNRVASAVAGFVLAIALQSATAVALIVSGFAASGYVTSGIGIATLLGADFGSAFVVRLLRHDLSLLVPILLLAGTIAFRATEERAWRQAGRILFGLGLLLLSLRLIGEASEPLKDSQLLPVIINYLSRDWVTAFLLAAMVAWLFHSSVATILLLASLGDRGLVPEVLVIPLVLGVNFGAAAIAAVLTRGEQPQARIIPLGNVVIRGAGTMIALAIQLLHPLPVDWMGGTPGSQVVLTHMLINGAVVVLGLLASEKVATILTRILVKPELAVQAPETRMSALSPSQLADPRQAAGNVLREVVALCEKIELMLVRIIDIFERPDSRYHLTQHADAGSQEEGTRRQILRAGLEGIAGSACGSAAECPPGLQPDRQFRRRICKAACRAQGDRPAYGQPERRNAYEAAA